MTHPLLSAINLSMLELRGLIFSGQVLAQYDIQRSEKALSSKTHRTLLRRCQSGRGAKLTTLEHISSPSGRAQEVYMSLVCTFSKPKFTTYTKRYTLTRLPPIMVSLVLWK